MSTWFVTNHYPYSDEPIKAWKSLAGEYFVCCCDMLSELVDQLSLALDDAHTRDTPVPKFSNQRSKPYGYTYTYTYTYTFLTGSGLEMALSGLRLGFMALDKTVPCARSVLKMLLDVLRMWCCTQPYPFTDEPIRAWQVIEPLLNMRELRIPDVKSLRTVSPGLFRLVVISDTHGRPVKDLPPGDIIIHAGDFTMCGDTKEVKEFANWFGGLDYKHRIVVAGNHEITFDIEGYEQLWRDKHKMKRHHRNIKKSLVEHEGITYLEDSGVDINGYKFWGSPWQPKFCEWAFQRKRGKALKSIWDAIPRDVDVLITHSPPVGMGDLTTRKERAGCVDLLYAVQKQIKPLYHLFGHVHEGYGMWSDGTTVFANASTCNHRYQVANAPIVFDLPYPVEPMAMSTSADLGTGREMDRAERLGSQSTSRGSSASLSGTGLQETLLVIQRSATSLRARAASAGGDTPGRLSPIRQKTGAPYMSRIEQSVYSVDAPFTAKTEQSVDSPEVTKIEQTVDLPAVPTNGEATGPSANTATITTTVTHTETTTTTTTENNTEVTNANTNTTITRSHTHTHTPTPAHAVGSPAHMHTNGNTSNTVMDSLTPDTRRRSRPHSPLARVRVAAVRKFSLSSKRATYPDGTPRGSTSNSPGSTRGTLPREGIGRDDKGLARNYSGGSNIIIRSTRTQGSPSEGKWRSKGKELAQKMLGRRQSYESNMNGSNQTLGIDDAYRGVRRQVSSPVGSVDGLRKVKPDGSPLDGDYEED
ncbi:hypothetical protein SARC_01243 [Sphaeroforma arctica JP610]|uniref:Calcineurin-like phosphoesterase domain-containing protein n=1 Tax=Sphaeroforma arctica JP610 TaxID=667725 RepID=A0A0L0GCI7_9EUKA|nr:hypothetical protein SARC_01243 [Sphaeroforma arctica JP610]KNC86614.1 hypothetical protein SARC_01243 [Sphaeroforma arctica JP610]|eukprot:XP_014160516.1 hypothetical protein SARC_01243 [Sphaeroforma arctica JP610]